MTIDSAHNKAPASLQNFIEDTQQFSRFFLSEPSQDFLSWLESKAPDITLILEADSALYRARISTDRHTPLTKEEMKPIPNLGAEGRANAYNVNVLYAADHPEIAIAETRAGLFEPITLATFHTSRELRIMDFAKARPDYSWYYMSKEDCLVDIGGMFSRPLSPSDQRREYIPTQIIAEFARSIGFDGIAYQSQFSTSDDEQRLYRNYALFELSSAEPVSYKTCRIIKQHVDISEIKPDKVYSNAT